VRLVLADGRRAHLSYCANVHPGERLTDLWAALDAAQLVRTSLGLEQLGLGLWLARAALAELSATTGSPRGGNPPAWLADELAWRGLEVVTMNGFPYGNFHADVVKRAVYHPDWTTEQRRAHTLTLAEILAVVLPADREGGTISTLPLAHRQEIAGDPAELEARACDALCEVAVELARLRDRTGKQVRICLEPEPGCLVETTGDAVRLWTEALPAAIRRTGSAPHAIDDHLGLCFDACHQAVALEDPAESLEALTGAGVPIGKMQLSSALVIAEPGSAAGRAALERFAEPRFLHQVRTLGEGGLVVGADDIDPDLHILDALPLDQPWRIHYHVPIHREAIGDIGTTREFLRGALAWFQASGHPLPDLEVETYTWSVLPDDERPTDLGDLIAGIAAELRWAKRELVPPARATR
jgi:sugar phosphate isomerase/epimerase